MNSGWPEAFDIYLDELLEWNKKFNLTSITCREEARSKHFLDSLTLGEAYDFSSEIPSVIDVGSGAGFPGLPIKISYPNTKMTLLDSTAKKVDFMGYIIKLLGLENARAVWARAEDHARENREIYDVALCRALAPLNIASELCLPLIKRGGLFLAMKGRNAGSEAEAANKAMELLGGKLERIVKTNIPGADSGNPEHSIVVIRKAGNTPDKYPRRTGSARKRPL
jgi:16S rRNA (guanine527-N7)-methyltransferase